MDIFFDVSLAVSYPSPSQKIRVLSEHWATNNLYCPSCGHDILTKYPNNDPVRDFGCANCHVDFELKSKKGAIKNKINDGAYGTMITRIKSDANPNFLFLSYTNQLKVNDLIAVPNYYFTEFIIEQRKPLSLTAKRAGWVGCNILIDQIPESGRIYLIKNSLVLNKKEVVHQWQQTVFLKDCELPKRRWLIEILKIIDEVPTDFFSLRQMYQFENRLKSIFPSNNHIQEKIRQQLQILRDQGLIEFRGNGVYHKLNVF